MVERPHRIPFGRLAAAAVLSPMLIAAATRPLASEGRRAVVPFAAWETTHVRVLTWNVGQVYLLGESRATDRALAHVAGVIADLDPDVVALQELRDADQDDRVVELLGDRYQGIGAEHHRSDRVVGLLARPGAAFERVPIASGRTALAVRLAAQNGDSGSSVVAVHLDAFNSEQRRRQAEELVAWTSGRPGPLVVAGDFNFDPRAATRGSADWLTYRLLSRSFRDVGADAGATALLGRRIDFILARDAALRHASARVVPDRRIGFMDHDPLLVDLDLYASAPLL